MSEAKDQQTTAPYASWKSFITFLELLADMGVPHRIDRTVMSRMSGATQSNIRVALAFLELTDSDGEPTDALRRLANNHGTSEEWEDSLRGVIMTAYAPLISELSLETGTADQLWRCFREHGSVRGSTLSRAVRFFLAALREAGVSYSPYFKAPPRPRPAKTKQEVDDTAGTVETPEKRESPRKATEKGPATPPVENDHEDHLAAGWGSHLFRLPNYVNPVEVRAPKGITKDEWDLIHMFMSGTIRLAHPEPSPPDCSEDEG